MTKERTATVLPGQGSQMAVMGKDFFEQIGWKGNMLVLTKAAGNIYEISPGQPLREFIKTLDINCQLVISPSSAKRILESRS